MPREAKRWTGELPKHCDCCGGDLKDGFADARIPQFGGQWAIVCVDGTFSCFNVLNVQLGLGHGQRYDGTGLKVEG